MRTLWLAGVLAFGCAWNAEADTILFDRLGTANAVNSNRGPNEAPLGQVLFSTATQVSAIGVYDALSTAGTQTFLIFNLDTDTLLYQSAAKMFAGDGGATTDLDTYKVSDPLDFTFLPGIDYGIGATASVTAGYFSSTDAVTQNGITMTGRNANVYGTTLEQGRAFASTGLELFGPGTSTDVPEPASLTLLGMGVIGIATMRRASGRVDRSHPAR